MADLEQLSEFQKEIEKELECLICLERLRNPRILRCQHSFCKYCLDTLLQFHADGSATIICPLNCRIITTIAYDKTTNNLDFNLRINSIVERISGLCKDNPKKIKCEDGNHCGNNAAIYCFVRNRVLCNVCRCKHKVKHEDEDKSFVAVKYDERKEKLVVWCDEHNTVADFVCGEHECHSKFLCLYCRERDHRNHNNDTIDVKSAQIKKWLGDEQERIGATNDKIQHLSIRFGRTKLSISNSRESLEKILTNRTSKGLSDYLNFANNEKVRLLNEFDVIAENHIQHYPINIAKYFQQFKEMDGIVLLLREEDTMKYLSKIESQVNIPFVAIDLMSSTSKSKPLGELKLLSQHGVSINVDCDSSSFSNSFPENHDSHDGSHLLQDMENFIGRGIKLTDLSQPCNVAEDKDIVDGNIKAATGEVIEEVELLQPDNVAENKVIGDENIDVAVEEGRKYMDMLRRPILLSVFIYVIATIYSFVNPVTGLSKHYPAPSCKWLSEYYGNGYIPSGLYWVKFHEGAQVYCDMDTGRGGWTMIGNVISNIPGKDNKLEMSKILSNHVTELSRVTTGRFLLSIRGLNELYSYIDFSQIRIYCYKPCHGRTVHIATLNKDATSYMIGQTSSVPAACNFLERYTGDNSFISRTCSKWNRWKTYHNRYGWIYTQVYIYRLHQINLESIDDLQCDDYMNRNNVGQWKFYVR